VCYTRILCSYGFDILVQRFSNYFQLGTTFISQNVLRTTLLLSSLKANCLRFSTIVCDTQFTLILFFLVLFTNVQSKRTTRAEPEGHLWSADHSLRNAVVSPLEQVLVGGHTFSTANFRLVWEVRVWRVMRFSVEVGSGL
jgi:hypothetical protein